MPQRQGNLRVWPKFSCKHNIKLSKGNLCGAELHIELEGSKFHFSHLLVKLDKKSTQDD